MKTVKKRALSFAVSAAMLLTYIPDIGLGTMVYAAEGDYVKTTTNTWLGTGKIASPTKRSGSSDAVKELTWSGYYVYYGKYENTPVKYRVLAPSTTDFGGHTMLLDCDRILKYGGFRSNEDAEDASVWAASDIKAWLNGSEFLGNTGVFTTDERNAIASSTKAEKAAGDGWGYSDLKYTPLTGEQIFVLDAAEATRTDYGYLNTDSISFTRKKSSNPDEDWWLRSQSNDAITVGYANAYGIDDNIASLNNNFGISPAFNVDLSSVLFSTRTSDYSVFKLTLKSSSMTVGLQAGATVTQDSDVMITVPYTVTGSAEQVSVLITDKPYNETDANIIDYGKLDDVTGMSGTGTFNTTNALTGTWGTDYHVYILAEDVNRADETDYASEPVEIKDVIFSGKCGENATWTLFDTNEDGTLDKLTISGSGDMTNFTNEEYVPWYDFRDGITSVEIGNQITSVGSSAFENCNALSTVTFAEGSVLKTISQNSFHHTGLTSISIPPSVTVIGHSAFYDNTELTEVNISTDAKLEKIDDAFYNCQKLTSITIPKTVTKIGDYAFNECRSMTDVYCYADPDGLTWTGAADSFKTKGSTVCHVPAEYYFKYVEKFGPDSDNKVNVKFAPIGTLTGKCGVNATWTLSDTNDDDTLDKLVIGGFGNMEDYQNEESVPWYDFSDGITSVEIGNQITSVGKNAFYDCDDLRTVIFDEGSVLETISDDSFHDTDLTSISIPSSVKVIGDKAFYFCLALKEVNIPDDAKLEKIGDSAFGTCTNLASINIPKNVTVIGDHAFYDCRSMTDVYCYADPEGLTWIKASNSFKYGGSTICHVPNAYYATYVEKFGPDSDNKVNVKFAPIALTSNVVIDGNITNGSVTVDKTVFSLDEEVILTITPDDGYVLNTLTWNGTNVDKSDMTINDDGSYTYSFTMPAVDVTVTATFASTIVDLATLDGDYTAQGGDVLTGSTSHTVTIADNAKITLSDATINGGIICEGSATISVEGSNNVTGSDSHAGIRVGAPGTTLTINGTGVLNATGGRKGAGIGLDSYYDSDSESYSSQSGGSIVIESGTINAKGTYCAGIGCGDGDYDYPFTIGDITIKGGTVTAVGQDGGYGIGKGGGYPYNQTVGTITITTGITSVDASGYAGSFSENIVYKDGDTDVTASKDTYFAISDEGNRRLISTDISYYNISIEDNITHGTVTASKTSAISGASITLSATPDYGYRLSSVTVTDSDQNSITINEMSFKMPASNVTIGAVFEEIPITQKSVRYIDVNGDEQTVTASVFDGALTELRDGWYVVDSTITIYDTLLLNGNVNIILVDDCTMTINSGNNNAIKNYETGSVANLTIYGQSKGTGNVFLQTTNGGGSGFSGSIDGTLTINGGGLFWNESLYIYGTDPAQEIFTLNAGRIARNNSFGYSYYALSINNGKGSINGGQVDLSIDAEPAIWLQNSELTLGYTKATDFIRIDADSFIVGSGSVSIADDMVFTDGTNIFDSNTPAGTLCDLSGVTLIPVSVVKIPESTGGTVTADKQTVALNAEDKTVTLTITPDAGYALNTLTLNGTNVDKSEMTSGTDGSYTYSFTMPARNVTVSASFSFADGIGAKLAGYSLSLDGDIGVNFYMELDEDVVADNGAYMLFTLPDGKTKKVMVGSAAVDTTTIPGKTYYVFKCNVAAKEMNASIKAQIISGDRSGREYTYTVKDYADYILNHSDNAYLKTLARAMLDYGSAAQDYFIPGSGTLPNPDYADSISSVTAGTINKPYDESTEVMPEDESIVFDGATLTLQTETTISLYFTGNFDLDQTSFTAASKNYKGEPVTYEIEKTADTTYKIIRIKGIKAEDIGNDITVTINGNYHVVYSPMNYCYNVINKDTHYDVKLVNVCKALYNYWQAANLYQLYGKGGIQNG